jgi:hypothetical protein
MQDRPSTPSLLTPCLTLSSHKLLSSTNFSQREIIRFYQNASQYVHDSDGVMSLSTFTALCKENGLKTATLIGRLFAFLDVDKSDSIELSEVVRGINPLLRGSIEDVARMCFDIYDLDGVSTPMLIFSCLHADRILNVTLYRARRPPLSYLVILSELPCYRMAS